MARLGSLLGVRWGYGVCREKREKRKREDVVLAKSGRMWREGDARGMRMNTARWACAGSQL